MPLRLEATEREIVLAEIMKSLNSVPTPSAFFVFYLGNETVARMPDPGTRDGWAQAGLGKAEETDFAVDGTHPLLNLLKALSRTNQAILTIQRRLEMVPRPSNPFTTFILDNGQLFLDRDTFRLKVQHLFQPEGPVVLRIAGDRKSGKWYSYKFLMFLSLSGKQIWPVSFQCGPSTTALGLAQTLLKVMGVQEWQQKPFSEGYELKETPLRVGQSVADWFLNLALRPPRQNWWWFFVKFLDPLIPADTKEFIRQLALLIANTYGARNSLRLVLVNFAEDLPPDLRRLQQREDFKLDRAAWEACFQGYIGQLKTQMGVERHSDLEDAQNDILAEVRTKSDDEFLATLCQEIEEFIDEI